MDPTEQGNLEMESDEEEKKKDRGRRRKRKQRFSPCLSLSQPNSNTTIFPLLMAATCKPSLPLLKKCLYRFRQSFLSHPQPYQQQDAPHLAAFLSLCPCLLTSHSPDIASLTAEIAGASSLMSFHMNQLVVSDSPTLKALISVIPTSPRFVSMAACNALLDLCSTCLGRNRLLRFSALETLMFAFLQVQRSSIPISLHAGADVNISSLRIGFQKDELPVLLLNAAVILINTCNVEQLGKIATRLSESFSVFLKEVWREAHKQMLKGNILGHSQGMNLYFGSININNLAESIFRLSINFDQFQASMPGEMIKRRIFCFSENDFKDFISSQWEVLPVVIRKFSSGSLELDEMFMSFMQSPCFKDIFPSVLPSILQGLTSCLPLASDELDILNFLKEVRKNLGCPLINEQDIRVLRTNNQSKHEEHFFQEDLNPCFGNAPKFLFVDDILKCQEAYNKGYTIALRGMEFRLERVALIADRLASIFGQPSAGANMYLTPPNSQGLARHYDDHCVFVCQIFGSKQWKIYSQPTVQLPRLYDPWNIKHDEGIDNSRAECYQFLLNEGDVLYIPRGFIHEAFSHNCRLDGSAGYSLHLTLAIEVEPPFEWEGFLHVALFSWYRDQHQRNLSSKSLSGILNVMSVKLLHVVIGLLGNSDHRLRKACLVAAASLQSDTNSWLDPHQKTIFSNLIENISRESRFLEALKSVEVAIQKKEDPFQRMGWLRFLNKERVEGHDLGYVPFTGVEDELPLYIQHIKMAENVFMQVKYKFCSEVSYDNVIGDYKMLHEKYKKARKQYMNGMLSLHCV